MRENDDIVSEPAQVASIFNEYYISIAQYKGVSDSIENMTFDDIILRHAKHKSIVLINDTITTSSTFDFQEIDSGIMLKYINDLSLNKAPGYDGLQPFFVKTAGNVIASSLCAIFNKCVTDHSFPSQMKLSEISPIFKKNDNLLKENYRSVNLLPILSKVLNAF